MTASPLRFRSTVQSILGHAELLEVVVEWVVVVVAVELAVVAVDIPLLQRQARSGSCLPDTEKNQAGVPRTHRQLIMTRFQAEFRNQRTRGEPGGNWIE